MLDEEIVEERAAVISARVLVAEIALVFALLVVVVGTVKVIETAKVKKSKVEVVWGRVWAWVVLELGLIQAIVKVGLFLVLMTVALVVILVVMLAVLVVTLLAMVVRLRQWKLVHQTLAHPGLLRGQLGLVIVMLMMAKTTMLLLMVLPSLWMIEVEVVLVVVVPLLLVVPCFFVRDKKEARERCKLQCIAVQ